MFYFGKILRKLVPFGTDQNIYRMKASNKGGGIG